MAKLIIVNYKDLAVKMQCQINIRDQKIKQLREDY